MEQDKQTKDLDCTLVSETERALLVNINGEKLWVPKTAATFKFKHVDRNAGVLSAQVWWLKNYQLD